MARASGPGGPDDALGTVVGAAVGGEDALFVGRSGRCRLPPGAWLVACLARQRPRADSIRGRQGKSGSTGRAGTSICRTHRSRGPGPPPKKPSLGVHIMGGIVFVTWTTFVMFLIEAKGIPSGGLDLMLDTLRAEFGSSRFIAHTLTSDLLETEVVERLIGGAPVVPGKMPLRDRYLPSIDHAFAFRSRRCVGGVGSLVAIARDVGDYLLLVQLRGGRVLNANGRLAIIPKAFHQPLVDFTREMSLAQTLLRELEEELLGREDPDVLDDDRRASPSHPASRTDPMQWLLDGKNRGVLRIELTGFGVHGLNGNYDFAALMVIEDPEWWRLFGDRIDSNWEAASLHQYSSLDTAGLVALIEDERWNSVDLFTCLQGLRRLSVIGDRERVAIPSIERCV